MAKKKGTTRKKTTKKMQAATRKRKIVITGLIFILLAIFAIFELGILGIVAANIFRLVTGNLFQLFASFFIGLTLYLMFKNVKTTIKKKQIIGISLFSISLLFITSIITFSRIIQTSNVVYLTFDLWKMDFTQRTTSHNLGGGLIGSGMYQVSYILVSNAGSWLLAILMLVLGFLYTMNLSFKDLSRFALWIKEKLAQDPEVLRQKEAIKTQKQEEKAQKKALKTEQKLAKQQAYLDQRLSETSELAQETYQEELANENRPVIQVSSQMYQTSPQQENLFDEDEHTWYEEVISIDSETGEILGEKEAMAAQTKEEAINNLGIQELENPNYKLPQTRLLEPVPFVDQSGEVEIAEMNGHILADTFTSFNVQASMENIQIGPAVTKYEVKPAVGVPVSRFKKMTDDLQLALGAKDLRMEAPIPGKSLIGIEVPNEYVSPVSFRDIVENTSSKSDKLLEVPIGKDIYGNIQNMDLTAMPHLLIAGSTGSGKSVAVNGIITSILLKAKPHEVKMVMVDPKMVELSVYNGIPHLLTPVVTNPKKAAQALNKVVEEMERRYELFAQFGIRKIDSYNNMVDIENAKRDKSLTPYAKMPFIVVIVDEMADLMMVAGKEVEAAIVRLAQKARAAGIHMILATQRPSVDVITGLIKSNIPSRMAFAVSSGIDSRVILDQQGAEKLLGRGDMLFNPVGSPNPVRVQGAFINDQEVERIVSFVQRQQEVEYNSNFDPGQVDEQTMNSYGMNEANNVDPRYFEIREYVINSGKASKSEWQRVFKMNFNTATAIMDQLENEGVVGPDEGRKPRRVLLKHEPIQEEFEPIIE
ncbi:MAG: DNA translocase FtsK [Streptococcaceae bacterium]|jgi:S-DNA-T family DNA segregation ATPase FtsK/SpoIIIE|nr:DNA translocase FtsK [Streptococcaceae bacterium]